MVFENFFWMLDRIVHLCLIVVTYLASQRLGPSKWKNYKGKNGGRQIFQVRFGLSLTRIAPTIQNLSKSIDGT